MAPKNKINLKDRCENGELDLSMSDLQEVPVKEIAAIKKATSLDLSNNRLTTLGKTFISLTHIIKLDLSKNMLTELPEDFGEMKQLKHLDLYSNEITHVPLSFCELRNLRWLDLKNNPLVPAVAKIAGPCLDAQQCQQCARAVVSFFMQMKEQIEEEKVRREMQKEFELEAEAAALRVQQKKKEKKKAAKAKKNKNKAERKNDLTSGSGNGYTHYDTAEEDAILETLNKKAVGKASDKPRAGLLGTVLRFTCFTVILTVVVGFILSASRTRATMTLTDSVQYSWKQMMEKLPESCRPWAAQLGVYIEQLHVATGRLVEHVGVIAADLRRNPHVDSTLRMISDGMSVLASESQKVFRTLSEKLVLISDEIKKMII